jgi:hypothetical protein
VGIDHLLGKYAGAELAKERLDHKSFLLQKQKEMQKKNVLNHDELAQMSIHSSANSIGKARTRAALAA